MRFGRRDRLVAGEIAVDLVGLAADLRNRCADRVGVLAMRDPNHLRNPGETVRHQKRAAPDRNQRKIGGFRLHPVDRVLDFLQRRAASRTACARLLGKASHLSGIADRRHGPGSRPRHQVARAVSPPKTSASRVSR